VVAGSPYVPRAPHLFDLRWSVAAGSRSSGWAHPVTDVVGGRAATLKVDVVLEAARQRAVASDQRGDVSTLGGVGLASCCDSP
jgi:hypothetical protein